jgi:hypothetical protein
MVEAATMTAAAKRRLAIRKVNLQYFPDLDELKLHAIAPPHANR